MMIVKGLVAAILSRTTVAVNVGTNSEVSSEDIVQFVDLVPVVDPVTKEDLGSVSIRRMGGKVISASERASVVKITDTYSRAGTRYLKMLTTDPDLQDYKTVLVNVGDAVEITVTSSLF